MRISWILLKLENCAMDSLVTNQVEAPGRLNQFEPIGDEFSIGPGKGFAFGRFDLIKNEKSPKYRSFPLLAS
jgi:hypothetical protein